MTKLAGDDDTIMLTSKWGASGFPASGIDWLK
jgi:hypothetical protein